MIALFALVGVDLSTIDRGQLSLQSAADAAAIAATLALESEDALMSADARIYYAHLGAKSSLESNGYRGSNLASFEVLSTAEGAAGVRLGLVDRPRLMMREVLGARAEIRAEAAAALQAPSPVCVMALADGGSDGVVFAGPTTVEMGNCAVHSRSTKASSVLIRNSSVAAGDVCAAGEINVATGGDLVAARQRSSCQTIDDPLAQVRPSVSAGPCDQSDFEATTLLRRDRLELTPGVYCGGLSINGPGRIRFAPGVYVIKDGPLQMRDVYNVAGDGVTFVLRGETAVLDINATGRFLTQAPATGAFAGIVVYNEEVFSSVPVSRVTGSASEGLEGAIYLPSQRVRIVGPDAPNADPADYTLVIAGRVEFGGTRPIRIRYNLRGRRIPWASQAYFSGGVRLLPPHELS